MQNKTPRLIAISICTVVGSSTNVWIASQGLISSRKLNALQTLSIAIISSIWGGTLRPSPRPWWVFVWLNLLQVWCMLSQLLWLHMCNCYVMSRKQFYSRHPGSWNLSVPPPQWSLSPGKRRYDTDIWFRAKNSTLSYSSCLPVVSVLITIYCKNKLL